MKRDSDTAKFVGHACQVCGKRVNVSGDRRGNVSGYWSVDHETGVVKAWHLNCKLGEAAA